MGEQLEIAVPPFRRGDVVTIHHEWGHTWATSFEGVHRGMALLSAGISGTVRVQLYGEQLGASGQVMGRSMKLWRVDARTLERLRDSR